MRKMKPLFLLLLIAGIAIGSASAQRRGTRKPAPKKTTLNKTVAPLDVRAAREKTEVQRDNLDQFINKLGPIVQAIEDIDKAAMSSRKPTKQVLDQNAANKQKVVLAIRNMKTGLANLESEFRTKPTLKSYLPKLQGVSQLAADAEDSAMAGKFVASKEPLRNALQKLTDTLASMPM